MLANLRVQAQIDRLIEKSREDGTLTEGHLASIGVIADLDNELSYSITRNKEPEGSGQIIKSRMHAPGEIYEITSRLVIHGRRELSVDEINWLADELGGL